MAAARGPARSDYGIHVRAGPDTATGAAALAPRAAGLKMYLDQTYGPLRLEGLDSIAAHLETWPHDRPVVCHAEERSAAAVILLAGLIGRPVHICHVARRSEVELIRRAKDRGYPVTCEVTPHHLYLTADDAAAMPPGRGEVRPVLGSADDRNALWAALRDGTIDCIATDHAPHTREEKDGADPPPGFPGLETSLALMLGAVHEGRLESGRIEVLMHTNPRRIFGLPVQEDTWIEVDPDATWEARTIHSRCGWTPFAGHLLRGVVRRVVLRGREAFRDGVVTAPAGSGNDITKEQQ